MEILGIVVLILPFIVLVVISGLRDPQGKARVNGIVFTVITLSISVPTYFLFFPRSENIRMGILALFVAVISTSLSLAWISLKQQRNRARDRDTPERS